MKLTLKRETLTDLTAGELAAVGGGAIPTLDNCPRTGIYPTEPLLECLGDQFPNLTQVWTR